MHPDGLSVLLYLHDRPTVSLWGYKFLAAELMAHGNTSICPCPRKAEGCRYWWPLEMATTYSLNIQPGGNSHQQFLGTFAIDLH